MVSLLFVLAAVLSACSGGSKAPAEPKDSTSQQTQTEQQTQEQPSKTDYPTKPIQMIVPWTAGGGTDLAARELVNIINSQGWLGQPIQVVNKPGASGTVGADEAFKARPDGYTISYQTSGTLIVQPLINKLPFDSKSFIPVAQTFYLPTVLAVNADAPWNTLEEFLEYAKANPGTVRIGHPGNFTAAHIAVVDLMNKSGIEFQPVPFQGAAPNVTALLGNHIEASMVQVPDIAAFEAEGKIRVLATAEADRVQTHPDIPTLKELGFDVSGASLWHAVCVPLNTPDEIVAKLEEVFKKAVETEQFKEFSKQQGGTPMFVGREEITKIIHESAPAVEKLLRDAGFELAQ